MLQFIYRRGNAGTNHYAVEVRSIPEQGEESVLKGYLTLTEDELDMLKETLPKSHTKFIKYSDKRRAEVDRGAMPPHIRPRVQNTLDTNKYK